IGAVIGLTAGFFGWEVSGIICGALLGILVLIVCIAERASIWGFLFMAPGGGVGLAVINWLFCWFPFRIDSSGTLVWATWALLPLLGLLGLMFTIAVWLRRPSRAQA